jgi:glycosyltransferase involved in cell wall biosynthesis
MRLYQHVGRLRGCSPSITEAIRAELPAAGRELAGYIPNPVPFDVPAGVDFDRKENVILFVGRLHPEKGVDVLIEAVRAAGLGGWTLRIVGPHDAAGGGGGDEYLARLRSLAAGLPVEFIGPVYGEEALREHYARARIFCYPAQNGSGDAAPVAPREAMAYGCVPVVSRLECFGDFVHDGRTGRIFDQSSPRQAVELGGILGELAADPAGLENLARQAHAFVQRYSPAAVAGQFLEDFASCIDAP